MSGLNDQERARRWFEETRRLHMSPNPDLHKVIAGYRKSLEFAPNDPQVLYHLGVAFLGRREWTNAEEQLRRSLRGAEAPEAWFHLGQSLMQQRRPEEAEQAYRKAVDGTPKEGRGPVYFALATALQSQYDQLAPRDAAKAENKLKQAEECYRLGLEQNPDDPQGCFQFALFLQNLSQLPGRAAALDEAEALLDGVLSRQPDQRDVLNLRALLHSRRGQFEEATNRLEAALAGSPEDAGLLFNLAQIREQAGDPERARELLERSLAVQPRQPGALSRLAGLIAQHQRDWDAALELIEKGLALAPRDPVLHYQKALVFAERAPELPEERRSADLEEARAMAEHILTLQPGFQPALALLARLAGGGQPAEGPAPAPAVDIEALKAQLAAAPEDHALRLQVAQALLTAKRFEEALPLLETLLAHDPEDRTIRVNYGLVLSYLAGQDGAKVVAARDALRKGVEGVEEPDSPILLRLVQLDLMLREPEEAADLLAELRRRPADPRMDEAQLLQLSGVAAQQGGRLEVAADCFRQALETLDARLAEGSAGALVETALREATGSLAQVLDQLGRDQESAAAYERWTRHAPRDGAPLFRLASVHNRAGRFAEGLEALRRLEALEPENPVTQYYLALTLIDLGRHEEAEACLAKALELRPDFPEAQQRLAFLQQNRPLVAASLEELEASVAADPEDLDDRLLLGQAYIAAKRWADAAAQLEVVAKGDKQNHKALFDLSQAWLAAGDRDKAIDCLVQLEERLPSDPGVRFRLAELFLENEEEDLAVKEFRNAVEMQPNNPVFQFRYGVALKAADHEDKAEKAFRRALELQSTFPAAHYELGLLEFTGERRDAALKSFITSYQQDSRNFMALYYCGLIKAKAERKEALKFFQSALGVNPVHADSHFQLGNLLLAEGRPADAAWHLNKALALWPEDAFNRDLAEDLLAKAQA